MKKIFNSVEDFRSKVQQEFRSETYTTIVYYDYGIEILDSNQLDDLKWSYVWRLRCFNPVKELYLWRSNQVMYYRIQSESHDSMTYTTYHLLNPRFVSKISMEDIQNFTNEAEDLVYLKVQNYLDRLPNHQATIIDRRFLGFTNQKEEN